MSNLHPTLDPSKVVDKRTITLPQGGELEVEMTQEFIDRLRRHFGLFGDQPLDDDHVRMYVWGAANGPIAKAEEELKERAKPAGDTGRVRRPRRRKTSQGS